MANNRRKTAAIAFAVLGVAGLSLASASTLNLTGGTLQAGVTDLTDCQTGTITATVAAGAFQATPARGFKAGSVTLSGITAGCANKSVQVALLDSSNAQIGSLSSTLTAATSITITNSASVLASDVKAVAVVIS